MPMKYAGLAIFILIPGFVVAQPHLPVGAVACVSLKSAQAYAVQSQTAPAFAEDLLARATCYKIHRAVASVPIGRAVAGFQAYQLISGHKVWLPVVAQ